MPPRRLLRRATATRDHPCRRPLDRGDVSSVLMDRFGKQCHAVLCLGQYGSGAAVSPGAMVLELVGLATGQRRRGVLRLVRGSNTDRAAGHRGGAPSRAVYILR